MRAVLFGDHVEQVEEKFLLNGLYAIVNAPIIASETPWKSEPNELNYQLHLASEVEIRCVSGVSRLCYIDYHTISQIKRRGYAPVSVDVLGVVLYISEETRIVTTEEGRVMMAREVVLTDHSCEEPLFITTLDGLAKTGCPAITLSAPDFMVASFTAILTSDYKGFSLTTSSATAVAQYPVGQVPDALRKWASENRCMLMSRKAKLLSDLRLPVVRAVELLSNLRNRTAWNTKQGECFWVKIVLENVQMEQVLMYIGCSNCDGPTTHNMGSIYRCAFCLEEFCQARQCLTWTSTMADQAGKLPLTLRTADIEMAMRTPVPDILKIINSDDRNRFEGIRARLHTVPMYVRIYAERADSLFPLLMWRSLQVEYIDNETVQNWSGPSNTIEETASSSGTIPKLPDFIVKAVSSFSNVQAACIDGKSPFSIIQVMSCIVC